jgi:thioredoxin/glutathione reductase (selenoprotein)
VEVVGEPEACRRSLNTTFIFFEDWASEDMKRFNIAGFTTCGAFRGAVDAVKGLSVIFPQQIGLTVHEHSTRDEFMDWLANHREGFGAASHKTSPFVWFEDGNKFLGGRDDTLAWCRNYLSLNNGPHTAQSVSAPLASAGVTERSGPHGFEYDLVVIGGGSGGLACAKEAKLLGAENIACLDFVRPTPIGKDSMLLFHGLTILILGTKWGLGGTCVNVGCIPKKLMHTAALMGEHINDSVFYGWTGASEAARPGSHSWEQLRDRVQDHIKSINFGYRVQLREEKVNYLNKLGKFISPHELECTDAKGKTQVITSNKFVIAVGGRPTALDCPGAELAISSDDIFSKETPPGKTCVVGAGYVALECAGFLKGLGQGDVTVLVRSMPLRLFDRDSVDKVMIHMRSKGINVVEGVLPKSIVKQPNGKLLVTYSNGDSDEFDTVLAAVGRTADTANLGLDKVGIATNAINGKISCINEQTSTPHIFAIGDVVEGAPELTPSAILAGKLLARRLFGTSTQMMDYKNIATTIFTPLEFGTVGYSEEDAIATFGAENIDCYVSEFVPLEWKLLEHDESVNCIAKIVVDKRYNEKVVGIHIVAPNAGEIMQGFGLAFKKGITHQVNSSLT